MLVLSTSIIATHALKVQTVKCDVVVAGGSTAAFAAAVSLLKRVTHIKDLFK